VADRLSAADVKRALADHVITLAADLLPGGHREGAEWRAGDVSGSPGDSLGVHLHGRKSGVWADFSTGQCGDVLDLVKAVLGIGTVEAIAWADNWLGGKAEVPRSPPKCRAPLAVARSDPWQWPWQQAVPISGTLAETYLASRGLKFSDSDGTVLRFAARRMRKAPTGENERPPALLAALSDIHTGKQSGCLNVYLRADGGDRLRDAKGKTVTGRARDAAVMLSTFDSVESGLFLCEGVETGIRIFQAELGPIWCCGGCSNLSAFPVLGGIEALTIAADADEPGQKAARTVAARWHDAKREVRIAAPQDGDWADRP
jgi:hypothetical protein